MNGFVERLKNEHKEINEKLAKLDAFMTVDTNAYAELSDDEKLLLTEQYQAMLWYRDTLWQRLGIHGENAEVFCLVEDECIMGDHRQNTTPA